MELCQTVYRNGKEEKLTDNLKKEILEANNNFAGSAIRVLGCAIRAQTPPASGNLPLSGETDIVGGVMFVGMVGMIDPPREEVREAIADSYKAGIKVVMIT